MFKDSSAVLCRVSARRLSSTVELSAAVNIFSFRRSACRVLGFSEFQGLTNKHVQGLLSFWRRIAVTLLSLPPQSEGPRGLQSPETPAVRGTGCNAPGKGPRRPRRGGREAGREFGHVARV